VTHRLVPADTASRVLVTSGIAVLVVGLVVGLAVPATSVPGRGPGAGSDTAGQVDPGEVGSQADLSTFERQLADRLANRARSGAVNLSSGDYQQARERLNGTQYESLLAEYRSVSGDSGGRDRVVAHRRMLAAQRAFVAALDRYETVHALYLSAQYGLLVANSRPPTDGSASASPPDRDQRSAVALAHRLERIERRVDRAGGTLLERYRQLERVTDRNFTDARTSVRDQMATVHTRQATVQRATLVPTDLRVTEPNTNQTTTVSVTDPLVVAGRLANDETPVADATVELRLGNETVRTRTDTNGRFELRLRPQTVSPTVTEAVVRYHPDDEAVTATSARTVPVNVTRVDSAVTAAATPGTVGFGDTLRVSGRITAATGVTNGTADESGTGIGNATFVVRLSDRVVARNETALDGTYDVAVAVPGRVPEGERQVSVTVPAENTVVTGDRANTTVTVVERTPNVSVTATHADDRTVRVTGNVTVGDASVDGHQVSVVVGDSPVGTATTDASGTFRTTVVVPADQVGGKSKAGSTDVRVRAVYRTTDGNLAGAAAGTTVAVPTGGVPTSLVVGGGLAVTVLLGGGTLVVYRRRRSTVPATPEPAPGDADGDDGGSEADPDSGDLSDGPRPETLLTAARDTLGSDADRAVRSGYAAVRQRLRGDLPPSDEPRTHWEFYRDCRDAELDEEAVSTLREVTERYEQVVYATESVSAEAAATTLDRVAALVDETPTSRTDGGPGARADERGGSTGPTTPTED